MKFKPCAQALFALALLGAAGSGSAQSVPPESKATQLVPEVTPTVTSEATATPMSDRFSNLDRDKDGSLTEREADRDDTVASAFRRLDESHDGTLDLAEFAQLRSPQRSHN